MKRLGFSLLLSLAVFGSVAAQTGSKHVDLKEITDGKFRKISERHSEKMLNCLLSSGTRTNKKEKQKR